MTRPALEGMWSQLLDHSRLRNRPLRADLQDSKLIDQLVDVLSVYDPNSRLEAMVGLMDSYGVLPRLGHGSAASLSIDEWLDQAGAPSFHQRPSVPGPAPVLGAWATFWCSRNLRRRNLRRRNLRRRIQAGRQSPRV